MPGDSLISSGTVLLSKTFCCVIGVVSSLMMDNTIKVKICIPKNQPKLHLDTKVLLIFRTVSHFCPVYTLTSSFSKISINYLPIQVSNKFY
jgi:hypothetical protein